MNKFKKKESILKRFYYRRNKLILKQVPRKRRSRYRYRKIMHIKAMRLDIRIRCYSCRVNILQHLGTAAPDLHLDIKGYKPYGIVCSMCKWYMSGGLHI